MNAFTNSHADRRPLSGLLLLVLVLPALAVALAQAPDAQAQRGRDSTEVQNVALLKTTASGCFVDTSQADFQMGVPNTCDLTGSPGDVRLLSTTQLDQQNTTVSNTGVGITVTNWGGQTFTPAISGRLVSADINLFCASCVGTTPALTLSLRATSGGLPTGADLASATIPGFSSGTDAFYTASFASPPTVTASTQYALVIRPTVNPSSGSYALTRSGPPSTDADVYPGGTRVVGSSSGTVWSAPLTGGASTDAGFKTYVDAAYPSSGDFISSLKDASPAVGATPTWTTLSWTASTPANASLQFQAAGSNDPNGPFNFVGPDGTSATFFTTSGASLAQFNGLRYVKYRAYLSTTDSSVTPTLNDVTICFANTVPDPPTAANDTATTGRDTPVVFPVLANDSDPDGTVDPTTVAIAPGPTSGSTSVNTSTGAVTYTPNAGYIGSDSFTYTVKDNEGLTSNAATVSITVSNQIDLSITKTNGVTSAPVGSTVTYTLVVSNAGPSTAFGATVIDAFPPELTGLTWTCTSANGGSCTLPSGSGGIGITVTLPPGATTTFSVSGRVAATGANSLANTASVGVPAGLTDTNPSNNTAIDTDAIPATTTPTPTSTATSTTTATATSTATSTATPTVTPTTPTALRPQATATAVPVRVSVQRAGTDRMQVTIAAVGPIDRIAWPSVPNVAVETLEGTPIPGGVLIPPPGSATAVFYVRKLSGASATLPLTVTGAFPTWQTFVGGGPSAW